MFLGSLFQQAWRFTAVSLNFLNLGFKMLLFLLLTSTVAVKYSINNETDSDLWTLSFRWSLLLKILAECCWCSDALLARTDSFGAQTPAELFIELEFSSFNVGGEIPHTGSSFRFQESQNPEFSVIVTRSRINGFQLGNEGAATNYPVVQLNNVAQIPSCTSVMTKNPYAVRSFLPPFWWLSTNGFNVAQAHPTIQAWNSGSNCCN